ncbi:MAG: hypothetical protein ALAOOOJD_01398 [bacterium]|nr:hypothetical protein [bacterium]
MQPLAEKIWRDDRLPALATVTDADAMTPIFAEKFHAALARLEARVESCVLERIQHRLGKRCRLLYRLNLRNTRGEKMDQWFLGKLVRAGQARRHYETARAAGNLQNGLWQAVSLWSDLEMVVWTFPNDPDMAGLVKAADPGFVQAHIEANLAAFGLAGNWRGVQTNFVRVKYMPGKRCVLRYHARLQNSAGEERALSFFSKTYSDGMSRFHYEVLQQVYARLRHAIDIPRPLLHLEAANTLWQTPWEGRPLMAQLDTADWEELFPRLAAGIASFHQSQCEQLPPANTLERAFDSAEEDAQMLGWLLPPCQPHLDEILARLKARREMLLPGAAESPVTPIHGAIRLEQFVARQHELALVDFDAVALGDPLYDVAEFMASLQYLEFTAGHSRQRLAQAAALFIKSYERHVPWKLPPARLAFYAISALLSKMHDTMKNLDRPAMAKRDAIFEVLADWLQAI